jgi:hypothetical protein
MHYELCIYALNKHYALNKNYFSKIEKVDFFAKVTG